MKKRVAQANLLEERRRGTPFETAVLVVDRLLLLGSQSRTVRECNEEMCSTGEGERTGSGRIQTRLWLRDRVVHSYLFTALASSIASSPGNLLGA